jgi:hypothetical protein
MREGKESESVGKIRTKREISEREGRKGDKDRKSRDLNREKYQEKEHNDKSKQ